MEQSEVRPYIVNVDSQAVGSALPHAGLPGAKAFARRLGAQVEDRCSLQQEAGV